VGQTHTEARHVEHAWQKILDVSQTLELELN
jgi:hypothetical protein